MGSRSAQSPEEKDLINLAETLDAYYRIAPNPDDPNQKVVFGTSGHRGAAKKGSFNQAHVVAITAAIAEYRHEQGLGGSFFIGFDTHLLSLPAFRTVLEVLAATNTSYVIDSHITAELLDLAEKGQVPKGSAIWTPTPAISHAIVCANKGKTNKQDLSDGIVITPSHNPPTDGGYKYNPEHGGPADNDATDWIAARANEILSQGFEKIPRADFKTALAKAERIDYRTNYVKDLASVIDLDAIREAGVRIGADTLGGASIDYWGEIGRAYNLDLTVINDRVDPRFAFMTLDWDEKIRMDCSSINAMAGTVAYANAKNCFDIVTGNDGDSDRHGIVAKNPDGATGNFVLMNPNHFLAVSIHYLFGKGRPNWPKDLMIGKTLVSSSLIDRVATGLGKTLYEVPVGMKWFVPGLVDGSLGFGGEESAGASFLRRDGNVWTTDKDGIIMALLAAEIFAKTGRTPLQVRRELIDKYGESWYERIDAPIAPENKSKLSSLSPDQITATELAGEPILAKLTTAPGNGAKIGGLKVVTKNAWFAARPSGTENVYKIYAESFTSPEHLHQVQSAAQTVVDTALGG
ncbi:phosphoglucomutase (alpha-D-glucose-1,6-bisphosphate-dependent) [Candidatus Saccharibacteria bacterium]|nr:phosphoglucomutase (alpha-D-glucose-1,6-bisphosphate-dependent) [Candidatus Saccharibacteria bacterium]